jgi:hypothetical protein
MCCSIQCDYRVAMVVLLQTIENQRSKVAILLATLVYSHIPSKHIGRPAQTCTQGPIFRIHPCSSRARQADQTNGLFETA